MTWLCNGRFSLRLNSNEHYDPNHERRLRVQWANLKQGKSLPDYISDFRALRLQLKVTQAEALDKFVRGLKPNTR